MTYFEFNSTFVAFRLSNWVRQVVGTLCSSKGTSATFPKMADTVVDEHFIEFCRDQFRRLNNLHPDDEPPSYVVVAMDKVIMALKACYGEEVASVQEPVRAIEAEIIPVLLDVVRGVEPALQRHTGKTLDVLEREIRRTARQPPDEAASTISMFWEALRQMGALPVTDLSVGAPGGMPQGSQEVPNGLITITVAIQRYNVSHPTVYRALKRGSLTSHRSPGAPANAPHLVLEADVASRWPKR